RCPKWLTLFFKRYRRNGIAMFIRRDKLKRYFWPPLPPNHTLVTVTVGDDIYKV
ncbi:hypothetical protein CEXT_376201, partial [Caerostris extrusa]